MDGKSLRVFTITDDIKQNLYKLNLPYFKDPNIQEDNVKVNDDHEKSEQKKTEQVISNTMLRLKGMFSGYS